MHRARSQTAKDTRRQAILAAALDEFFERGLASARMDDIAKRAGLSKGALYLYFDSKDAVFKSIIEGAALQDVEPVRTILSTSSDPLVTVPALLRLLPSVIRASNTHKIFKLLVAEAQNYPELVTRFRENVVERALNLLTEPLQQASANGQIAIGDAALTARLIIAPAVMSVIWHVVFEHDESAVVDLDALLELHGHMLVRAMTPEQIAT